MRANTQFFLEHLAGTFLHRAIHFNPDRGSPCPLAHDLLDRGQKIGRFVHLDIKVSIPGDPEWGGTDHFKARE
jgi:hypothetical protein